MAFLLQANGDKLLQANSDSILLAGPPDVPFQLWPKAAVGPQRYFGGRVHYVGHHVVANYQEIYELQLGVRVFAGPIQKVRHGVTVVCHPSITTPATINISEEMDVLFSQKPTFSDGALAVSRYRR